MLSDVESARQLVEPTPNSPLTLSSLKLAASAQHKFGVTDSDTFLFTVAQTGTIRLESSKSEKMKAGTAAFIPAGRTAELTAGPQGLDALRADATAACDIHAALGPVEQIGSVDNAATGEATGKRTFQVLFGPENGSCRVTLFVGYVPPGRAPWHFHNYDEIVWIWQGNGRFHIAEGERDLPAGSAVRMRPRQIHSLENLSTNNQLLLLGFFTPAGSPAAAFLADEPSRL